MITKEMIDYAEAHSTPEYPALEKLNRETNLTQVYPRMLAGHLQGTLLRFFSHMIKPKRILEIGTFTGYSTINLAQGLGDTGILHTIEVNPELESFIHKFLNESEVGHKVVLHIGDAMKIIPTFKANKKWDLVYMDADKPNYLAYYKMLFDLVNPGGYFIADNALWDGKVLGDKKKMDKDTRGIAEFNDFIQKDVRVENLLLPFRDGLMVIRKL